MESQDPLKIPPQTNVITLEDGMSRTNNWRQAVKPIYGDDETNMPHAIFIPFQDIIEMSKLQTLIQEYAIPPSNTPTPICIVGVRAYFSMEKPVVPTEKKPLSAISDPVSAVMVPVFQITADRPPGSGNTAYCEGVPTYDLIAPVPSAQQVVTDEGSNYSIYDITQPCPKLCDVNSDLH
jgi:hypothetical protein